MRQRAWNTIRDKSVIHRDPLSLERVRNKFVLVRNKTPYVYEAYVLFDYIVCSGDFRDPIARVGYDSCELLRLEHKVNAKPYYLTETRQELEAERERQISLMGLCDALETELGEQVDFVRAHAHDIGFERTFHVTVVPNMVQCFENLISVHRDRCRMCMSRLLQSLHRDPIPKSSLHQRVHLLLRVLSNHCRNGTPFFL